MTEFHIREELRNVVTNYPLWPGNTISHAAAAECSHRKWIVRDSAANWIPTAAGVLADEKPFPSLEPTE